LILKYNKITMTPISKEEGKRLKQFLKHEGIKPIELARQLGVNRSVISLYISGSYIIPSEVLRYLNKNHRLSFDWFYNGVLPMNQTPLEPKNVVTDTAYLKLEIERLSIQVESYMRKTDKVITDFYASKHGVS